MIGIPTGKFIMSLSQLVLLGNWALEADFKSKWKKIKNCKALWVLLSFYFLHLIALLWTKDLNYALNDIRIKLPLLWLPVLFVSSPALSIKEFNFLIRVFVASVVFACIISFIIWLGITPKKVTDIRDISVFNSHIRFALMIVLSCIFVITGDAFKSLTFSKTIRIALFIGLSSFLILMESLTGIFILIIVLVIFLWVKFMKDKNIVLKLIPFVLVLLISFFLYTYFTKQWSDITYKRPVNLYNLDKYTMKGNLYRHDIKASATENGNFVYLFNCVDEMRPVWNRRSKLNFDSLDRRGNPLWSTLIRFLTSMNLRKDSTGIVALSQEEIRMVENGVTNIKFANANPLQIRMRETLWELAQFVQNDNPSGHSLAMRLEFWKTGWLIYKENSFFGVGTGDVQLAFNEMYNRLKSKLDKRWRLRAHNQYLTVFITFGFFGGIVFFLSLLGPAFLTGIRNEYYIWFMIIVLLSMVNEDTLETQAGVTFYAFFNVFLLFQPDYKT
jgi:hypothetical protein